MTAFATILRPASIATVALALALSGCESTNLTKRIDYKSTTTGPALELPPDLTTPRYDDRFSVSTASGLAAQQAGGKTREAEFLATAPNARVARAGNERWLVVKASPEQAWDVSRRFWADTGFVLAVEQPALGLMETDWAENRADIPADALRRTLGQFADIFYTTYKRDKFRTRIERGIEPGTVEVFISHRGMEQVPTTKIDGGSPAAFAWAVLPPNPNIEAEMLGRMMLRFGAPQPAVTTALAATAPPAPGQPAAADKARLERGADGTARLVIDDGFDQAWRRVGLALDRTGFTVVDRDRTSGLYYVRYADPDSDARKAQEAGWLDKLMFWKTDDKDRPEQYRIKVAEEAPKSVVTVQDPKGVTDRSANSERMLALLREQLR